MINDGGMLICDFLIICLGERINRDDEDMSISLALAKRIQIGYIPYNFWKKNNIIFFNSILNT